MVKLQQLYKSTQRKIDNLSSTRVRLARLLREQRMARKAAHQMRKAVERKIHGRPGSGCERCYSPDFCRCDGAYS
jgi:hypothetical protein